MKWMKQLNGIAKVLVVVGSVNWGLFGLLKLDLVQLLLGSVPLAQQAVYVLVGLGGVVFAYNEFIVIK